MIAHIPECPTFPDSWTDLTTDKELPVANGVTVQATCNRAFSNEGDAQIMCGGDGEFFGQPQCVVAGEDI